MSATVAIPQPKTVPVLGNLPDIDINAPVQSFMRLAHIYGPIFRLSLAGRTIIFVSSQELVNEVCDASRFDKRVHRSLENLRDFAGDGLFTAYQEEPNWALAHRLLMPAFGPFGIRGMFDKMLDIAEQMLTRWERFGGAEIDVADNMTRLTLDTIALCAFNYRFNSFYQNEMHPFVGALVSALDEAGARTRRPDLASRMMLLNRRRYEADICLMHNVADTLIEERRHDPTAAAKNDLLSTMLNGRDPITGEGLTDENIRFQLVTFLAAGHETTSGLLSFALYLLLKNPAVLAKARSQVDEVLAHQLPRVEDLSRLRYLEQILMETLRAWPTVPVFAVKPFENTVIGGRYAITTDDTVFVLLPILHRDSKVWGEDADAFKPERFTPNVAETLPPNAWKPFGNGERACIGRGFAMQEAQLVLAMILQRFDLVMTDPSYQLQIKETLTLKPHGFLVRARPRGEATRPRSTIPSAPQRLQGATQPGPLTRLLILYGSNTGSCEAFAQRIAGDAAGQGYAAVAAPMDEHVGHLPKEGAVIIVTASYEGHPPDNARQFLNWVEGVGPDALTGVQFAVFGCGNRQWARTYQAIPKRTEAALAAAGATRIKPRGETDVGGDFFGSFEEWYAGLWDDLGRALGKETIADAVGASLDVNVVQSGREVLLRLMDLQHGRVIANRPLVDVSSPLARPKHHIEIALPPGMTYRAGDYLAVLPHNPRQSVDRALRLLGLAPDTQIIIRKGTGATTALPVDYPIAVSEILSNYVELEQPATKGQVTMLATTTRCPPDRDALTALAEPEAYEAKVLGNRLSLLDLLERFPACEPSLGAFLSALPPMRARQYSISSSPLWHASRCSLTVALLDAPDLSGRGRHIGVASSYLAGLEEGARVSVTVRPSQAAFHPPWAPETPIIMVCAGSGIAPFRGFLQERAIQKTNGQKVGAALLFFGNAHPDVDYLYREELAAWEDAGVVSVRTAFSQAPADEVRYVQDRVWQDRAEVADLFRQGAIVFVCGDGEHMAPAVRATFVEIYRDAMQVSADEAAIWTDKIERETGRYVADVFA